MALTKFPTVSRNYNVGGGSKILLNKHQFTLSLSINKSKKSTLCDSGK